MDNNYSYNAQIVSAMPKIIPVHKLRDSRAGREILLAAGRSSVETLARSQRDRRRRKSITGPFVGWDGEGVTISDGSHIYTLMANSYGDTLSDPGGLRTLDILQWITDIARRDSQANHVIFGGSYDANMILADLTFDEISTLVHTGCVWIRDNDYAYAMRYLPRKYLHIIRYARHSDKRDSSIKLYDTIGTFQSSFVAACEAWLPSAELGFIKEMKANRSTFQPEDMSTITDYCVMECQLLVQLMGLVRSHAHSVGIYPTRWDGAGAMAAVLLKTHKVKLYMTPTIDPTIQKCERYAYFGGRIELVRFGHYNGPVFAHDLVGAYPSVLPELPCLEHGNWTTERDISLDKVAAIP
ncbi:MAG: hypothetical protein ACREHG_03810, partial [Candidatus Saccharimonadales bacterium]